MEQTMISIKAEPTEDFVDTSIIKAEQDFEGKENLISSKDHGKATSEVILRNSELGAKTPEQIKKRGWERERRSASSSPGRLVIKEEPPDQDEEIEVSVNCTINTMQEASNGSDELNEPPGDIAYICQKCGCTFCTSSAGEYYFCGGCKEDPQCREYLRHTCTACFSDFYSVSVEYKHCGICEDKQAKGTQLPIVHAKSYAKYECRMCSKEFYCTVGQWLYCYSCKVKSMDSPKPKKNECSSTSPKYILYSCKLCLRNFYSSLTECFYCTLCSSANSWARKNKKKTADMDTQASCDKSIPSPDSTTHDQSTETDNIVIKKEPMIAEVSYASFTCKVCQKPFFSSIGEWDYCSMCNPETRFSAPTMMQSSINMFVRNNIIYTKHQCGLCLKDFFTSNENERFCRKCRKEAPILQSRLINYNFYTPPADQLKNFINGDEEDDEDDSSEGPELIYAKYMCRLCNKSFYSRVGDYYICSDCNPETRVVLPERPHKSLPKKNFQCSLCDFQTHLKKEMRKHIWSIPKGTKRVCACRTCSYTAVPCLDGDKFDTIYSCKKCNYTTKFKKRLKTHNNIIHKGKYPVSLCKYCEFRTKDKWELKNHLMEEHRNELTYSCKYCDFNTMQHHKLRLHVAVVHRGEKPFPCSNCDFRAVSKSDLKEHVIMSHHCEQAYRCADCEYVTHQKGRLRMHIWSAHIRREKIYCEQCAYSSCSQQRMERHLVNFHGKPRPHSCTKCDYSTCHKGRLVTHMASAHKEPLRFDCPDCDFTTDRGSLLKRHSFEAHRPYGKVKQQCPHCGYVTVQKGRMRNHIATCHPRSPSPVPSSSPLPSPQFSQPSPPQTFSYECSECSFKSNARKIIRDHIVYSH